MEDVASIVTQLAFDPFSSLQLRTSAALDVGNQTSSQAELEQALEPDATQAMGIAGGSWAACDTCSDPSYDPFDPFRPQHINVSDVGAELTGTITG